MFWKKNLKLSFQGLSNSPIFSVWSQTLDSAVHSQIPSLVGLISFAEEAQIVSNHLLLKEHMLQCLSVHVFERALKDGRLHEDDSAFVVLAPRRLECQDTWEGEREMAVFSLALCLPGCEWGVKDVCVRRGPSPPLPPAPLFLWLAAGQKWKHYSIASLQRSATSLNALKTELSIWLWDGSMLMNV